MNTAAATTTFSAFANRDLAVVRVSGPGTCRESGRFENLLSEVERRGIQTLVVDLEDCPRLDSTFAGALLRLAGRVTAGGSSNPGGSHHRRVVLAGVRDQVRELLDTLYVLPLFEQVQLPDLASLPAVEVPDHDLSRDEILALSLDGHERLAALSNENARRFAALLPLLRQELAKPTNPQGSNPDAPSASSGKETED